MRKFEAGCTVCAASAAALRTNRRGNPQLTSAAFADTAAAVHSTVLIARPNMSCAAMPDLNPVAMALANSVANTETPTAPATERNIAGLAVATPMSGMGAEFLCRHREQRKQRADDSNRIDNPGSRTHQPNSANAAATNKQAASAVRRTRPVAANPRPQTMDAVVIPAIRGIKCKPASAGDRPCAL